ncbi:MAG: ABC-type Na+ efflux pump permease component-like protein [Anaerocolumna sp.]|nr:ABC-type Na+ efflux pump permease component-like protein [Anaerocolumna sp.]
MKKSSITGWKDICSFTMVQTLKNKTFVVSYIIMLVLALAMIPIINMVSSADVDTSESPITKVYVVNETALPAMDYSVVSKEEAFSHITFEDTKEDVKVITDRIEKEEKNSVIITISDANGMYSIHLQKAAEGSVKDNDLQHLSDVFAVNFKDYALNTMGITKAQLTLINAQVNSVVSKADETGNIVVKEDTSISNSEYWFIYAILFIIMLVNMMASTQIATSIVTEKSTKVIEYILVSVKPLAIIVGKVVAMLSVVLLQMGSLFLASTLSLKVSEVITGKTTEGLTKFIPSDVFSQFNVFNILLCLISIGLGLIFYGTLAGLAGATVSKLEELNEGLTLLTFTTIIGAYVGIGAANVLMVAGNNPFVTFSFLFPLSSPFILPGAILLGKISLPLIALSIAFQIIFAILLAKFVAGIYETLILHNGNKIKITQLLQISKTLSKGAKNEK